MQWLALASEYRSRVKKHDRVSSRLASPRLAYVCMLCVYATMNVLHNMASDAARHRLTSARLASADQFRLCCTLLHSRQPRGLASPRLASRMWECPLSPDFRHTELQAVATRRMGEWWGGVGVIS